MFLPDDRPQIPISKPENKSTSLTPRQLVDQLLDDAFALRRWSSEQRFRYKEALDPVLRAHILERNDS